MRAALDQYTVVAQTLKLIAEDGLNNLKVYQIAQHLDCSISDISYYFPSKIRMLKTISNFLIDNQLKVVDSATSRFIVHDRLFEILISFCEANDHYRLAIRRIVHDLFYSPQLLLSLSIFWHTKYKEILQNFDINFFSSMKDQIKFNGLLLIILKFYYSWITARSNNSDDLMHQLDKLLRLWEKHTNNIY